MRVTTREIGDIPGCKMLPERGKFLTVEQARRKNIEGAERFAARVKKHLDKQIGYEEVW